MSNTLREQAQFRKAKTPIIDKYQDEHAKLMSTIAGRGFLNLPGYAYDVENRLEMAAKIGLSDINYKILSESIDREMKQSGIEYDWAYKNAVIVWELEKQALMASWDAELMGIKQGEASQEATLELLAIEVSKRAITLMEAKTAIDLDMEAYRKTLADLDGDTAAYEIQLANAKVLTAQKKLELLPIFQEILTKEQELLVIEQGKVAAYAALMAAELQISDKQATLTPFLNQYAAKLEEYAGKIITDQIPKEEEIALEKIAQAESAITKSGYQVEELAVNIETEAKELELAGEKRELATLQFTDGQAVIDYGQAQDRTYQNAVLADFTSTLAAERNNTTHILGNKTLAETTQNATKLTSANTMATGRETADTNETSYEISMKREVANAQAAAALTASLTHLIR